MLTPGAEKQKEARDEVREAFAKFNWSQLNTASQTFYRKLNDEDEMDSKKKAELEALHGPGAPQIDALLSARQMEWRILTDGIYEVNEGNVDVTVDIVRPRKLLPKKLDPLYIRIENGVVYPMIPIGAVQGEDNLRRLTEQVMRAYVSGMGKTHLRLSFDVQDFNNIQVGAIERALRAAQKEHAFLEFDDKTWLKINSLDGLDKQRIIALHKETMQMAQGHHEKAELAPEVREVIQQKEAKKAIPGLEDQVENLETSVAALGAAATAETRTQELKKAEKAIAEIKKLTTEIEKQAKIGLSKDLLTKYDTALDAANLKLFSVNTTLAGAGFGAPNFPVGSDLETLLNKVKGDLNSLSNGIQGPIREFIDDALNPQNYIDRTKVVIGPGAFEATLNGLGNPNIIQANLTKANLDNLHSEIENLNKTAQDINLRVKSTPDLTQDHLNSHKDLLEKIEAKITLAKNRLEDPALQAAVAALPQNDKDAFTAATSKLAQTQRGIDAGINEIDTKKIALARLAP